MKNPREVRTKLDSLSAQAADNPDNDALKFSVELLKWILDQSPEPVYVPKSRGHHATTADEGGSTASDDPPPSLPIP